MPRSVAGPDGWWAALDARGMGTFWVAVGVVLGVQFLGLLAYSTYLFHRFDLTDDFATYSQAWWLIGHGHLNPVDTVQMPHYPFWQSHFELAMWPLAVVGRLWPHSVQLLWLQDVAIAATEWIALVWVAAICSERAGRAKTVAAAAGLVFLVVNPWWYLTASFDVHFEVLGLPFVVWSAYSLWRGRPRSAVAAAVVGLFFGDVVAVAVVGAGIAGLISSRARRTCGWRVPALIVIVSVGWVVVASALGGNKGSGLVTNYGYLVGADAGSSPGWVAAHLALHPWHPVQVLFDRRGGIGRVVASGGLLGLATPWGLVVAAAILIPTALNVNQAFLSPSIAFQTLVVIPFVFVGTTMVLVRVGGGRRGPQGTARPVAAWLLAATVFGLSVAQNAPLFWTVRSDWWRVDAPAASVLRRSLARVPPTAQAIVSQGVIGRFAGRGEIYPLLTAPQSFPVRRREVVFVIAPLQGIESVPPASARADVVALTGRFHASVVVEGHGVTVLVWHPAPGIHSIVLP